jgi:glycosyltransferase involved in cell wall biosynthesis
MMGRQTIVWIAHEANLSGANSALLEYVDVLQQDYNFHIILPHTGKMEEALAKKEIPYSVIYQYSWAGNIQWWKWFQWLKIIARSIIAIKKVKAVIRIVKAEMVFTNALPSFVGGIAAYQSNKTHVWWIHEFGEEDFGYKIGWGNQQWALRKMQQWSKLVICNSDAVKNKFQALMPLSVVKRIYQPVSWDAKPSIANPKKARFLMFGQIISSKGHLEVLNAIIKMKDEYTHSLPLLHIKGPCEDQQYLNELLQFIRQHDLQDKVMIETGFFSKEEVMPLYEAIIVASRAEAFGRVIVEANKAGLWAIVKNSGGAPELVNETNGLLYNNIDELATILKEEKSMPFIPVRQNYNEQKEIDKLKKMLAEL